MDKIFCKRKVIGRIEVVSAKGKILYFNTILNEYGRRMIDVIEKKMRPIRTSIGLEKGLRKEKERRFKSRMISPVEPNDPPGNYIRRG